MPLCRRRKTPGDGPAEHRRAGSASRPIRVGSSVSAAATNNPSRGEGHAVGTPRLAEAKAAWPSLSERLGRQAAGGLGPRSGRPRPRAADSPNRGEFHFLRIPRSKRNDLGFVLESAADSPNRGRCGCGRAAAMRGVPLLGVARSARPWGRRAPPAMGARDTGGSSAAARSDAPLGRVAN